MPKEDKDNPLYDELINREIQGADIFLSSKAARTAVTIQEYIETRLLHGANLDVIKADLLADLEEGGRMFGEFRNAVRATSNGIMNRVRDDSVFSVIGIETSYRWVAVLVNTCPDCLERHGRVQKWAQWEEEGLPRTGQTVCKENCRCVLLPEDTTEIEPIKRERR